MYSSDITSVAYAIILLENYFVLFIIYYLKIDRLLCHYNVIKNNNSAAEICDCHQGKRNNLTETNNLIIWLR